MKKTLTIVWVLLVLLTAAMYILAEDLLHIHLPSWVIMLFSVLKFLLVGWFFVELRHAHPFWRVVFSLFILLLAIVIIAL